VKKLARQNDRGLVHVVNRLVHQFENRASILLRNAARRSGVEWFMS
jgi:hypothetical protein